MTENWTQDLSGVAETLLIPLCIRAMESRRPDALIKDEQAMALVQQMGDDASRILARVDKKVWVAVVLCSREFDRYTSDFLARHPQAAVVHIGCGLDARFQRVDNGQVEWYDLDLPEVIELRRRLIGGEGARYHLLPYSALDRAWPNELSHHRCHPILFLAERVFIYFEEAQVRSLVLTLKQQFSGAELLIDAFSPFLVWANNLRVTLTGFGVPSRWSLKRGKDLERWGDGICLLDEWYPYACPEPRLGSLRRMRFFPPLMRIMGIFHYRLGESPH